VSYYIIRRSTYHRNIIFLDNHLLGVPVVTPFREDPKPLPPPSSLPPYPAIYLPIYKPTYQQPTNLPTYLHSRRCICPRRTWCTATADAIVYWTGLEKTASVALEPISPARHYSTWCCIIRMYARSPFSFSVLSFFYHYYYSFPTRPLRLRALFRSDLAVGKRRSVEGKGGELAQRRYTTTAAAAVNVRSEQRVYVRVFFYQSTKNITLKL